MKNIKKIIILLVILITAYYFLWPLVQKPQIDPLNSTYLINNKEIKLTKGLNETPAAPGSAAMIRTSIFGVPALGNMNNDKRPDAAVFITQNTGGSGTFFYIVILLNTKKGIKSTNSILLGDRIYPESMIINQGQLSISYYTRTPGESMTSPPTMNVAKNLIVENNTLIEGERISFSCDDKKWIKAIFHYSEKPKVQLSLNNNKELTLSPVPSESGKRYENKDKTFIFWVTDNSAFIMEGVNTTFSNCLKN